MISEVYEQYTNLFESWAACYVIGLENVVIGVVVVLCHVRLREDDSAVILRLLGFVSDIG